MTTKKKIPAAAPQGTLFPTKSLGTGYFFSLRTALKGPPHPTIESLARGHRGAGAGCFGWRGAARRGIATGGGRPADLSGGAGAGKRAAEPPDI
jgi:hypothetical protein